jgi:hypothetical protein
MQRTEKDFSLRIETGKYWIQACAGMTLFLQIATPRKARCAMGVMAKGATGSLSACLTVPLRSASGIVPNSQRPLDNSIYSLVSLDFSKRSA